ncbi:unnamed protein product [Brachionus calyciflorus]|uniref:Phosphodiesterase n=1 Tax=Brachionus calyciflorus TaxID=104777 RepID=A0A814AKF6_9BILA|nr:unnamed protein product [Brachionus calyciflorus]
MAIVPRDSIDSLSSIDEQETEKVVENFLSKNRNWFELYALENLDLNIVEKWLLLNNKKLCRCVPGSPSKNKSPFQRRKSVASGVLFGKPQTLQTNQSQIIDHHFLKPVLSDTFQIKSCLVRSSSFNSLFSECIEDKVEKENKLDESKEENFYLETENEKQDYMMNVLERSVFSNKDSASNSQLLKLLKSKIKLPNYNKLPNLEHKKEVKRSIKNKYELINYLIQDTSKEVLPKEVSEIIRQNLKVLVDCEYASLFMYDKAHGKLYAYKYDPLFSKCCRSNDYIINNCEMEFDVEASILGNIVQKGMPIVLNSDQIKYMRYDLLFEKQTDIEFKSILCMPIKNVDNEVIGVIQLTNKLEDNKTFNQDDIKNLENYLEFCGTVLTKSLMYYLCAYEYERCRGLLQVLHDLFQQQTNLEQIFYLIMEKAQIMLKCESCVILIDSQFEEPENSDSPLSFDIYQIGNSPSDRRHSTFENDGSKISRDLVNYVLSTGNKINLKDPYSDPRFDPTSDMECDYLIKSKLLMPIKNIEGKIIGLVRVINRLDSLPFDENDEQLLEVFCIFCGLCINNTLIYSKLEKSMAEKTVALDLLSYHANFPRSEMENFINKLPANENFSSINQLIQIDYLSSYKFDDFSLNYDEMILAVYTMFKKSNLMKTFKIDKRTMFQFLMTVRKNYRDVDYHNWNHAFSVCQSMFAIFMNSRISKFLHDTEKLALLVACLCHDLDHRGTNNLFQIESQSPLTQLYGTQAPMEKHHFNHCIMIINSPGHNIFSNVKPKTYELLISLIKEAILATDLADHLKCRVEFNDAVRNNANWMEQTNKVLLRKNLMTVCDLASSAKPWKIHKNVVNLVTKEFFAQGARERNELHIEPNEIMDERRRDQLPRLQIGWIDAVCLPLFQSCAHLCKTFEGHVARIKENRLHWSLLNEKIKIKDVIKS